MDVSFGLPRSLQYDHFQKVSGLDNLIWDNFAAVFALLAKLFMFNI